MIITNTGFLVAFGNRNNNRHGQAIRIIQNLVEPIVTTYPGITETAYLLAKRVSIQAQISFLEMIAREEIEGFEISQAHLGRVIRLIRRYDDLPMDFADASLVVLAEVLGHGRSLTVDNRDFSVYRWSDRNSFQNLFWE